MFGSVGFTELLLILIILIVIGLPLWAGSKIARKAGFSPYWGVMLTVPLVGLVVMWIFAFVEWPNVPRQAPAKNSSRGT